MATAVKEKPKEEKVEQAHRVMHVLGLARVTYKVEPYIGAPEEGVEPYERVLYRYALSARAHQATYEYIPLQLNIPAIEKRAARFGRDQAFETHDFITEVLASDVNVAWQNRVTQCTQCQEWVLSPEDLNEQAKANAVCFHCADQLYKRMDKDSEKEWKRNQKAREAKFAVEIVAKTGLSTDDVLDYLKFRPNVARTRLTRVTPVKDIVRETYLLTTEKETWPKWFTHCPASFQTFVKATGARPINLFQGLLPADGYKTARAEYFAKIKAEHEATGSTEKIKNPLPQSPRLMGVMQAFGCNQVVMDAFEKRTNEKGFSTTESTRKANDSDAMYISNEASPLFNIGTWGEGFYASCQNYKNKTQWADQYCRTLTNLEDRNVMVAWVGSRTGKMKTRILLRLLKDANTGETLLGLDRWYGGGVNQTRLTEAIKIWAKERNLKLVNMSHNAGAVRNIRNHPAFTAVSLHPVQFSDPAFISYSDLGAWQPLTVDAQGNTLTWTYHVAYTVIPNA